MRRLLVLAACALALLAPDAAVADASAASDAAPSKGGFTLRDLRVPAAEVIDGGPGRDAIPSVDDPQLVPAADATWVGPLTEVVAVEIAGDARAYPLRILEYHQIVNDTVGDVPVAVTYDPLAGTPFAWRRRVGERTLTFGVSGLLYNHNFLLFDRETGSLWSQFLGKAIAGPLAGETLRRVAARQQIGAAWLEQHPGGRVLRHPRPDEIDYRVSPYQTYWVQDEILFPVAARDDRYHPKELVLGVVAGGEKRAYLGSIVTREGGELEDTVGGVPVRVRYDTGTGTFTWEIPDAATVVEAYWLAWKAFHPDTEIWRDEKTDAEPDGSDG